MLATVELNSGSRLGLGGRRCRRRLGSPGQLVIRVAGEASPSATCGRRVLRRPAQYRRLASAVGGGHGGCSGQLVSARRRLARKGPRGGRVDALARRCLHSLSSCSSCVDLVVQKLRAAEIGTNSEAMTPGHWNASNGCSGRTGQRSHHGPGAQQPPRRLAFAAGRRSVVSPLRCNSACSQRTVMPRDERAVMTIFIAQERRRRFA